MVKKALLVGINAYRDPSANLRGCLNDVTMMSNLLMRSFGFKAEDIRMLTDSRATKANIIDRLKWLVADLKPGDSAVFHYSGHGSLIALRDGAGRVLDRQHPIICTYELNWDAPLSFEEIGNLLIAPDGANITSILDCCHSGHDFEARALKTPNLPVKKMDIVPRFLAPPIDIAFRGRSISKAAPAPKLVFATEQNDILMTGCGVAQTSADAFIDGAYRGAFTYSLNAALTKLKYKANYKTLIAETTNILKSKGFTQRPQIEGALKIAAWPLFSIPTTFKPGAPV